MRRTAAFECWLIAVARAAPNMAEEMLEKLIYVLDLNSLDSDAVFIPIPDAKTLVDKALANLQIPVNNQIHLIQTIQDTKNHVNPERQSDMHFIARLFDLLAKLVLNVYELLLACRKLGID